jgi:hypothetical protein
VALVVYVSQDSLDKSVNFVMHALRIHAKMVVNVFHLELLVDLGATVHPDF